MIVGQASQPRVALLIESSRAYGRGILAGVAKYIRQHGNWVVFLQEQSLCDEPPPWLASWQGDGIISRIDNRALAECVARLRVPTVYLRNVPPASKVPSIATDNDATSRLAFEHLQDTGRHSEPEAI